MTTWLREPDYDRLCKLALRHGKSLGGVIRDRLTRELRRRATEP